MCCVLYKTNGFKCLHEIWRLMQVVVRSDPIVKNVGDRNHMPLTGVKSHLFCASFRTILAIEPFVEDHSSGLKILPYKLLLILVEWEFAVCVFSPGSSRRMWKSFDGTSLTLGTSTLKNIPHDYQCLAWEPRCVALCLEAMVPSCTRIFEYSDQSNVWSRSHVARFTLSNIYFWGSYDQLCSKIYGEPWIYNLHFSCSWILKTLILCLQLLSCY